MRGGQTVKDALLWARIVSPLYGNDLRRRTSSRATSKRELPGRNPIDSGAGIDYLQPLHHVWPRSRIIALLVYGRVAQCERNRRTGFIVA